MTPEKLKRVARLCSQWKREARAVDDKEKKSGWLRDTEGRAKVDKTEARLAKLVAPEKWWSVYIEWDCCMWRFEYRKKRSA